MRWGGAAFLLAGPAFADETCQSPYMAKITGVEGFVEKSGGAAGPHSAYALPGRMLIPSLSNKDGTGRAALVECSNDSEYIATHCGFKTSTTSSSASKRALQICRRPSIQATSSHPPKLGWFLGMPRQGQSTCHIFDTQTQRRNKLEKL
ncbi:hypothetical protein MOX02_51290 [Methylobacterium oxalidis]|uniref:Uncharacterized protein n=1 Tax=Methylobacterium oxalidis TaxID=944322 RepID=A0A512JAZ1_9HYPH|nr:hypothetical protein MOX02_51290 [Methylobacterium oxalidis]GJE33985.1 hypothetical protein LDDCCGHA_4189 [Methylobacterium oxalidis]GLS66158.1 hypothetical protein GCM10007888_45400 [Methylobacterium oxalidis]